MKLTEREWREATDLRPSTLGLVLVLFAAALLRLWGLRQGIPYAIGVDEPEIMERAVTMMKSGDYNPHFFDYPSLYIYIQTVVAVVRYVLGAMDARWGSLAQVSAADFYLWGRAVTAAFGVGTVWLIFQAGLRWGARHALLAAALLAVLPMHVRESHYVLTDVPLTFFVTAAFLLSLRAHEHATAGAFAWAGAAAGLAAATKYNGVFSLVFPLLACWMTIPLKPSRAIAALAAVAAFGIAYIVAAPYTLLDLPAFLNGFGHLSSLYHSTPALPEPGYVIYLKHLRNNFGWPALLLAIAGLIMGIVRLARGPGRVRWALAVVFCLLYFWFISRQNIVYGRYLLPIVPLVCLLVACAVVSGVSQLRRYEIPRMARTLLIIGLTVAALLPPSVQAINWDRNATKVSTVALAYDWIFANLPRGSRITVETRNLILPAQYPSENVPQLRARSYDEYVAGKVDYLIASSQSYGPFLTDPAAFPREYAEYNRIFTQAREVAHFAPSNDHPGPELRILKVKP
jgi:4-amino-4-deoxy-L-arabinose transferase-like glycosyltransferase